MDQPKNLVRSALQFFFGTVLSRCSGFLREVALSAWFGATPLLASFFIAYRFSQVLRRLFGESSLLGSFSPHFEALRKESPEKAQNFFRDLFLSLSFVLTLLVLVLEGGLFAWKKWGVPSESTSHIIFLTMVMLPGVVFVCLYALFSALLQTEKKYFLPSAAPVFFNLVFIGAMYAAKDLSQSTLGLAIGVTLAFFIQWIATLWASRPSLRNIQWLQAKLFAPELRQIVKAMALTIIGIGAVQINGLIDALFARYADLSGPAYLYYALRLYQLPLALFGLALSSALLPPLSRALQQGDTAHYQQLLNFSLVRSFGLMLPITFALFATGDAVVNCVYGRGAFDATATLHTTTCLWGYTLGLIPAVFVLILAPAFYAMKDYKTPLYAALLSVAVNLLLNTLLIFVWKQGSASVAIATSLAAYANAYFLSSQLSKKIGPLFNTSTLSSFKKMTFCGLLATAFTAGVGYFMMGGVGLSLLFFSHTVQLPRDLLLQIIHLTVLGGVFVLLFFSYAWMMGVKEAFELLGLKKLVANKD
jgi:putative peptidoglycan lipid II flippase